MIRILSAALALILAVSAAPALRAQDSSPWVAVARGTVDVSGGLMRLAAQREGLIAEVMVEEGDRVTKGQVLARIDSTAAALQLDLAEAEAVQAETQVDLAQKRLEHARAEAARLAPLAKGDAVPRRQIDEARRAAELAELELKSATQAQDVARQRANLQRKEVDARTILAPVDGVILRRSARVGDATSTSTVTEMFLLAPDGPRVLRAQIDEQFVGLVHPGQRAEVMLERDAGVMLSGQVERVAAVFGSARAGSDVRAEDARTIEITVRLDGPEAEISKLVLGQRMIARVLR